MEKSGRQFLRLAHGRLLSLLACIFILAISAGMHLTALEVDLFVSSFEITAGEPLVISLTARGSEPASTSLAEPQVPVSFLPSSGTKELVQLESTGIFAGSRTRGTVIRREWIPSESGSFSLGPFTVSSGAESITLPPVYITVVSPKAAEYSALQWAVSGGGAVTGAATGKAYRITLEGLFEGTPGPVACAAPENALLAAVPQTSGENPAVETASGWRTVAIYDWTPLAAGTLSLPSALLEYTAPSGAVRKIASQNRTVDVSASAPVTGQTPVPRILGRAFTRSPTAPAAKTGTDAAAPIVLDDLPADLAERLSVIPWQKGNYAVILHALRSAEYGSLFPSRCRTVRLAAEAGLSLGKTLDVPPAAWKFWCVTGFAVLLFLSLLLRLSGPASHLLRGLSYTGFICSVLLAIFAVYVYTRDMQPAGVAAGGDLLTVPEPSSTVIETLAEGRTVHIRRRAGEWLFVSTDSSLEGWLPAAGVLQYTLMETDR